MCIVHCALCTMCMHHLLTPSHLHRLQAIIFPQDWHFQYPTAEIDKEDPPAWENDQVLIFLLKNCENEGSLKPRPVSVRFIMPQHRPPTQPNLSESRSTNGITDCLSGKQQFPTKFRRNLEISRISGMTSKPKKRTKVKSKVIRTKNVFWWVALSCEITHWDKRGLTQCWRFCRLLGWLNWKSEEKWEWESHTWAHYWWESAARRQGQTLIRELCDRCRAASILCLSDTR